MVGMNRKIIHVDMDAFYAAIEQRDHPELQDKAVIIGGKAHSRGVVSTASYEARKFGVHSAMPMAQAVKLCPHGVCIAPDLDKYRRVSKEIMEVFSNYTNLVEPLSLDEAFLDVTGSQRLFGDSLTIGKEIKNTIKKEIGLTCSIGIAANKFLAKLASELEKPDGIVVINAEDIKSKLWSLPISKLWGIGPKSGEKLAQFNIKTIGQVAKSDQRTLISLLGSWGAEVYNMANGLDNRLVVPEREACSIGHETTFSQDINDVETLKTFLLELAQDVGWRLRRSEVKGKTVVLKLRYADFKTITRNYTFKMAIDQDEMIYSKACELLEKNFNKEKSLRLIGITMTTLGSKEEIPTQVSFFEEEDKSKDLYRVLDGLNLKYGEKTVTKARLVNKK